MMGLIFNRRIKVTPSKIPVLYCPEMCADRQGYSPSPSKPAKVVDSWSKLGVPLEFIRPTPATREQFYKAHGKVYTNAVLTLETDNGFGTRSADVAHSLPYTSGSMIDAVKAAMANGIGAVSPTSGFHHAGFDFGGGYCTFNGLMVAVRNYPQLTFGIIDFDAHYGNGTDDIIQYFQMKNIMHWTYGERRSEFSMKRFAKIVEGFRKCDIVLYQAGQDPLISDPIGGYLTAEELLLRDRIVFLTLRYLGVPCVWNLAGGYSNPFELVLKGHDNTMQAFAESFFND